MYFPHRYKCTQVLSSFLFLLFVPLASSHAQTQWPSRTVKIVVPFAAGGKNLRFVAGVSTRERKVAARPSVPATGVRRDVADRPRWLRVQPLPERRLVEAPQLARVQPVPVGAEHGEGSESDPQVL